MLEVDTRGLEAFRHLAYLCSQSEHHRSYSKSDAERCILPPLALRQNRFLSSDNVVTGFASWAFLTPDAAQAFVDGTRKLGSLDWDKGSELWLIDVIAPFRDVRWFCRSLRQHLSATYPEYPVVNFVRSGDRHRRRTLSMEIANV